MFRTQDAPRYWTAWITHIILYGIQLVTIVFLRIRLMRLNVLKRRALALAKEAATASGALPDENIVHKHSFDDLTDWENPECKSSCLLRLEEIADLLSRSPLCLLMGFYVNGILYVFIPVIVLPLLNDHALTYTGVASALSVLRAKIW